VTANNYWNEHADTLEWTDAAAGTHVRNPAEAPGPPETHDSEGPGFETLPASARTGTCAMPYSLTRPEPMHWQREWQADPHWVRLHLAPRGGPVEQYLTMTGGTRAVELGSFLTPEERLALHGELASILPRLRGPA
jgi:hypothetical protein